MIYFSIIIGNNHPNWLIFSEGFKPSTSNVTLITDKVSWLICTDGYLGYLKTGQTFHAIVQKVMAMAISYNLYFGP